MESMSQSKNNVTGQPDDPLFKLAFEQHGMVMLLIDPASKVVLEANQSAADFYGYSRQELQDMPLGQIYLQALDEGQAGKKLHAVPHRMSDGKVRTVEIHTSAIAWNGREVLFSVIHDITEREQAQEKVRESEDRLSTIFNNSPVSIAVTHMSYQRFIEVNPAFEVITGYPVLEIIGRSPGELGLWVDPERRVDFLQTIMAQGYCHEFEYRLRRKDGQVRTLLLSAELINLNGEACVLSIGQDITERKEMEHELRQAKASLEEALLREQALAQTDSLTSIHNRRHLFELAERELAVATRYKHPLAVILFDIDHFKSVNDAFGHATGDLALIRVTQAAKNELRNADVIGRYGGEEFILLLPMTSAQQAQALAERIRKQVEAVRIASEKGEVCVTLSMGIVEVRHAVEQESVEDIFRRADVAMYAAKSAGRNRVVVL